ncbi:MAG: amidohydrolase family protein [Gemmatimonadota bacterium]|nr:amidohydrolase family protein [Gemmatimonadota bacterium]
MDRGKVGAVRPGDSRGGGRFAPLALAAAVAVVVPGAAVARAPGAAVEARSGAYGGIRVQEPPQRLIQVTLTEGTNIAAALSPDGTVLAFDLVGRIWVMPVAGGRAVPITDPVGDARQPSWAPDGTRIAFQAYWDGNYHVWSVAPDGSGLRQHTRGPYDHREPHWSPDGDRIAFSSDRMGSYDIWMLTVEGGAVTRVTEAPGSEYGPAFSPDGSRLALAAAGSGDAAGIWVLEGWGGGGGPARRVASTDGGQVNAPGWDARGAMVIYNEIGGGRSVLRVVAADGGDDAEAGTEPRVITGDDEDVFPFRVSANPRGFVYTADGLVRRRGYDGSGLADIPFTGTVTLDRTPYERRPRDLLAPGTFPVRGIVSPAVSPDGHRIAFAARGDLWVHSIGGGTEQLTDDPWIETDPAWSPDGSRLAFSSDRDGRTDLYIRRMADGNTVRVTEGAGATMAAWAPDGNRLAFVGSGYQVGISVVELATGSVRTLRSGLNGAGRPSWSPDGRSIVTSVHQPYAERFREGVNRAVVIPVEPVQAADGGLPAASRSWQGPAWNGHVHGSPTAPLAQEHERFLDLPAHTSIGTRGTDGPVRSPDGRWLAYVAGGVLWAVPTEADGDPATSTPRRLTNESTDDPTWTGDSRSIVYLGADRLRRVDLLDGRIEDIPLSLTWSRPAPPRSLLIRAGAMWDGRSEALRRDVDILIEEGRIVEVADRDPTREAARVIDAADEVVMPGLIEMHAHGGLASGEQVGRLWLSYGVTSVRCPACDPWEMAEAKEAGESGRRNAPRWFGTGGTIDGSRIYYPGAPALGAPAQLELEMARVDALGYDLVKTYVRLADPAQKRAIEEAHALGVPVTSHELYPAVAFGADGVEHVRGTSRRGYSTKVSELSRSYGDVVALLAASGMTIAPTVGIYGAYGLLVAEDPSLFDDERVEAFFPRAPELARRPADLEAARRPVRDMASLPRQVIEAGGRIVMGTDAPINPPGISLLAEMEALVRYGEIRSVDVLRATTSVSGEALGYGDRLGVVAPGAIADLIVIGEDPTRDIRALRDLRMVIHGGRIHEAQSLLQRAPQSRPGDGPGHR